MSRSTKQTLDGRHCGRPAMEGWPFWRPILVQALQPFINKLDSLPALTRFLEDKGIPPKAQLEKYCTEIVKLWAELRKQLPHSPESEPSRPSSPVVSGLHLS